MDSGGEDQRDNVEPDLDDSFVAPGGASNNADTPIKFAKKTRGGDPSTPHLDSPQLKEASTPVQLQDTDKDSPDDEGKKGGSLDDPVDKEGGSADNGDGDGDDSKKEKEEGANDDNDNDDDDAGDEGRDRAVSEAGPMPGQPKYYHEDAQHPNWIKHRKHMFILSSAGKPIYSRYGNETKLSATMAVCQAMVSFVEDKKDHLKSFVTGEHKFVFLQRGAIYLVAISRTSETIDELTRQLGYMHDQIISILTSKVDSILARQSGFDLRGLLGGTEKMFASLIHLMNINPSFMLGSVHCLCIPPTVRSEIGQVMHGASSKSLLYSILVAKHQLVNLVRHKKHHLHPDDLLLILNLVNTSASLRTSETWTPICLPAFNDRGFLYAHVSFLAEDVCLLLLSTADDDFYTLNEHKNEILRGLQATGALNQISASLRSPFTLEEVGISPLLHFLYKARSTCQYIAPAYRAPYLEYKEQKRLYRLYQHVHTRVHSQTETVHRIYWHGTEYENILGWVAKDFELYACFGPLLSKSVAITACNALLRWIKKEEHRLFILNSPVW